MSYMTAESAAQVQNGAKRMTAWGRILDSVVEMRDALECRIYSEDPNDTHLAADCRTWCELSDALVGFLKARRAT